MCVLLFVWFGNYLFIIGSFLTGRDRAKEAVKKNQEKKRNSFHSSGVEEE